MSFDIMEVAPWLPGGRDNVDVMRIGPFVLSTAFGALVGALIYVAAQPDAGQPLFGFTPAHADAERRRESQWQRTVSPDRIRDAHRFLTATPHVAGSPRDRELAEWVRDRWIAAGLEDVEIVEHEVLLSRPVEVTVENADTGERASMTEDPVTGDEYSSARDVGLPFHAYSASGDIEAPVVYAGSGSPSDYDWLAAHGIDIKGKIALVRYSVPYSYRGFKALTAQQRGAAGILIYSDPADDGSGKGKVYPDGPWGNDSHIQRGAIAYDFLVPGDPLTPGWASVPGAPRISADEAVSVPKILSAPLSARDARWLFLEDIGGPEAPKEWQGGLPLRYHVGPGPHGRMIITLDNYVEPIWTVTGRIRGADRPDDLVVLGNHRDAWVYGGVDPSGGSAALMELAETLGAQARAGERPRRTIVFASWDAEEFTLASSTEWGEQHADVLRGHAIAYLNVDSGASGPDFSASAVPALNRVIEEAAQSVTDPRQRIPVAAAWRARLAAERGAPPAGTLVNNRLGSGSDYTVFLNFLGMPIADLSFDGPYGVYHSVYDNHRWVARIGDPGFRFHSALTQVWGLAALRLANADVLPLDYTATAWRIREFLDEIDNARDGVVAPAREALARFERAAAEARARMDAAVAAGDPRRADALNRCLIAVERAFLDPAGLPGRPWYRHQIYAPKPTYEAEVLPGLAAAIQSGNRVQLAEQASRLSAALDRAAAALAW